MPSTTGAGTAASSVKLNVGPLVSAVGKLRHVRNTAGERATKLFTVCPGCQAGKAQSAGYKCSACDHTFDKSDLRGKLVGGEVVVATTEEIEAAKQSGLPKGVMDLAFYPAEQVEAQTVNAGVAYYFEPDGPSALATLLVRKAADPAVAVVGVMKVSSEKFYRLTTDGKGNLFLTELMRPEESHRFAEAEMVEPKEADAAMFDQLVEALTDSFDPDIYASAKVANLTALLAERAGGAEIITLPAPPAVEEKSGLESALAAALAAAKAKKEAAA